MCDLGVFSDLGALWIAKAGLCDPDTARGGDCGTRASACHSWGLLPADTMLRALRPGPHAGRGRVSDCSPRPERRLGALNRSLRDPPTPRRPPRAAALGPRPGPRQSRPRRRPRRTLRRPGVREAPRPARAAAPRLRGSAAGAPGLHNAPRRWGSVARGNCRTRDSATGAGECRQARVTVSPPPSEP